VIKAEHIRHQVAIGGRVIDGGTKKPIGGARVSLTEIPPAFQAALARKAIRYGSRWATMLERPDRAITAADGLFYFLDLPNGKYRVMASVTELRKRCGTAHEAATVSRDAKGNLKIAFIEIALQSTTVQGKVTGSGHKAGVCMAEVRVKGSGERAYCDAQGQYVLSAVEPGKRTILVFAPGYRAVSKPVTLNGPGVLETLNFALVRETG
jgi:hypothetical protein